MSRASMNARSPSSMVSWTRSSSIRSARARVSNRSCSERLPSWNPEGMDPVWTRHQGASSRQPARPGMALGPARWDRGHVAPGGILDDAIGRAALVEHVGKSGAALERVTLRDGRTVVVKRVTPESDLTLAVLDTAHAPELRLWQSGGLDRLP